MLETLNFLVINAHLALSVISFRMDLKKMFIDLMAMQTVYALVQESQKLYYVTLFTDRRVSFAFATFSIPAKLQRMRLTLDNTAFCNVLKLCILSRSNW
ncbi:hypothetical protein X801_07627, partial [Opisthorchis viverrini]